MKEIIEILKQYKIYKYSSKEVIFNQGSPCSKVGFVLDGEIKISHVTYQDKEETISLIKKNQWFGNMLLFLDNANYLGDVIALRQSEIIFLNKDELINLLKTNTVFLNYYLKEMSIMAFNTKQQNKLLSHKNIKDRIMYSLKEKAINNKVQVSSITNYALELSVPRESLSRILKQLQDENLIKRNKHQIYLNY